MTHNQFSPLIAAHRGYKSKYAENTIAAFQGAIDAGAKCIETDVQLSGDGTVIINHDPRTGRNYDKDLVIGESTLEELKQLKNLQDPALRLLTFKEFLEWAVEQPEETKIMLDIKANNSIMVLAVMQRIMLEVNGDLAYWRRKLIFGFWTLEFYEYAYKAGFIYGFEVINITFSPTIAKRFIEYSLTLPKEFQLRAISLILVATYASEFKQLHEELMIPNGLDLYLWTLNTQADFDLGYRLDCKSFITDDPIAAQAAVEALQRGGTTGDDEVNYDAPHLFSLAGATLGLRFGLFRVFEFCVLNNLMRFALIQGALRFIFKNFVAKGQK